MSMTQRAQDDFIDAIAGDSLRKTMQKTRDRMLISLVTCHAAIRIQPQDILVNGPERILHRHGRMPLALKYKYANITLSYYVVGLQYQF